MQPPLSSGGSYDPRCKSNDSRKAPTVFRKRFVTRTSGKLTNPIRYSLAFVFLFPRRAHKAVKITLVHDGSKSSYICNSGRALRPRRACEQLFTEFKSDQAWLAES
jgi:hypothetical protein